MTTAGPLVDVHLLAVPVALWSRAQEQTDALLRELALVAAELGDGQDHHLPVRLIALVAALSTDYGAVSSSQEQELFDAAERGQDVIDDLAYRVPAAVGAATQVLGDLFEEADAYCRAGEHLLTLAAGDDVGAFRRWFLGEFVRQAAGRPALPWPEFAAAG